MKLHDLVAHWSYFLYICVCKTLLKMDSFGLQDFIKVGLFWCARLYKIGLFWSARLYQSWIILVCKTLSKLDYFGVQDFIQEGFSQDFIQWSLIFSLCKTLFRAAVNFVGCSVSSNKRRILAAASLALPAWRLLGQLLKLLEASYLRTIEFDHINI